MKKSSAKIIIGMIVLILLASCKPSDKYAGDWYALSSDGERVTINFSKEKIMTVTRSDQDEETFEINQTTTGIQNSVRYFRVEIEGTSHYMIFDNTKDEDNAKLVKQTNHASDFEDVAGDIIYLLNRNDFPSH